ncbi:MAG: class I SAM-dependent methyltransferase [Actinobacteria bacterium]|nr:class I SAM-dependent methyltransferase [Actinomycetota bacterium]
MRTVTPRQASSYDSLMQRLEARYFPDTRAWVCGRAGGDTLEIAVGTGLNLGHYAPDVRLTAVDVNEDVLGFARTRMRTLNRRFVIERADAAALPYTDGSFDAVVCTFALCEVPDDVAAIREALRVLRPGGSLLLADHIVSTNGLIRFGQRLLEAVTIPLGGEHFTRRPSRHLDTEPVTVEACERFAHGAIERVHARKLDIDRAAA